MSFYVSNTESTKTSNNTIGLLQNYLDSFDIGDYKFSNSTSDKGDWLLCDGRTLLRSEYPELFNVISDNYGSDTIEDFKIPNFAGRIFGQVGNGHVVGDDIGTETVTLTTDQIPSHNHTGTTEASGVHNHTNNSVTNSLGLVTKNGQDTATATDPTGDELNLALGPAALTINSAGEHTHTFTSNNTGGGESHNNIQPTLFAGNVFILSRSLSLANQLVC